MKYAKLLPPRLRQALDRERLFTWVAQVHQDVPIIWMSAPPGAGKTTFAASLAAHLARPLSWITLDAGDNDPASLFQFCALLAGDNAARLPVYDSTREQDLAIFARRFFRSFFTFMPADGVLVLDDVHALDWQRMGAAFEAAFAEAPHGILILALSRQALPARLARLELNGLLTVLDWEGLRFDENETRSFLGLPATANLPPAARRQEGWAAGLAMQGSDSRGAEDSIGQYFEGEVLARLPAPARGMLMKLASLDDFDANDALLVTGAEDSAALLRQLWRERLFLERLPGDAERFRLHGAFAHYLRQLARHEFSASEEAGLRRQAAALLEQRGALEGAAELYRSLGDTGALADFLKRHARTMFNRGQRTPWAGWYAALPPAVAAGDAVLQAWRARMLVDDEPVQAFALLERAEQDLRAQGDERGRLAALATIVDCYYHGLPDMNGLRHWLAELRAACAAHAAGNGSEEDQALDLQASARLALATMLLEPHSAELPLALERTLQALMRCEDGAERLAAGTVLLHCMDWLKSDSVRWLFRTLDGLAEDDAIEPLLRCRWYARKAICLLYLDGDLAAARRATEQGLLVAELKQVTRLMFSLSYHQALVNLALGDTTTTERQVAALRQHIAPTQSIEHLRLSSLEACLRLQTGDTPTALAILEQLLEQLPRAGLPAADMPRFERFLAGCCAQAGDYTRAEAMFAALAEQPANLDPHSDRISHDLIHAYALAQRGQMQSALPALQAALAAHRLHKQPALLIRFPLLAARMVALALDADIEKEHVLGIIRRQQLRPPGPFAANWPWPVAVRALGSLTVSLNAELLAFSGKAQQRPLVLLKALLLVPDAGQTQQQIADHLWPDLSDARASLNVTIHRLRKLLGSDEAIVVSAGRLAINRSLVWSDVDALGDLCDRIQQLPPNTGAEALNSLGQTLLGLYRGPFADGNDEPWLLAGRERWRSRFLDAATALGLRLEAVQQLAAARTLYLSGLEVEPLAETLYRNLMRCAHAQNDPAAAFSAYRRCRETLSVILGKRPSKETEKLAVSIGLIERVSE